MCPPISISPFRLTLYIYMHTFSLAIFQRILFCMLFINYCYNFIFAQCHKVLYLFFLSRSTPTTPCIILVILPLLTPIIFTQVSKLSLYYYSDALFFVRIFLPLPRNKNHRNIKKILEHLVT